jgi:hypothetical protein
VKHKNTQNGQEVSYKCDVNSTQRIGKLGKTRFSYNIVLIDVKYLNQVIGGVDCKRKHKQNQNYNHVFDLVIKAILEKLFKQPDARNRC